MNTLFNYCNARPRFSGLFALCKIFSNPDKAWSCKKCFLDTFHSRIKKKDHFFNFFVSFFLDQDLLFC